MGSDGMFTPDWIEAAGPENAGRSLHLGSGPDGVRQSGVLRERVLPAYEDKFGEEPQSVFHAHSFDAMMMITAAIEEAVIQEGGTTFIPGPR